MVENDWDNIREQAFNLVWEYRDREDNECWKYRSKQEKKIRINVELDRMLSHVKNPESPLFMLVGRVYFIGIYCNMDYCTI